MNLVISKQCPECNQIWHDLKGWTCPDCRHVELKEYEPPICHHCNGSGEGYSDGSRCQMCNGKGVNAKECEEESE